MSRSVIAVASRAVAARPTLIVRDELVEDVLGAHGLALGRDLAAYRGHVYRTLNFARALLGYPRDLLQLKLAAAFHDVGLWTDRTFDYLEPSARRALSYAAERSLGVDLAALGRMIEWHHKLTTYAGGDAAVEAFRRADFVDLSFGLRRFGLPRALVAEVRGTFPNAGFHACLCRFGLRWAARHPARPLPVLRW